MTPAPRLLLAARGVRAFGDGLVSLILPVYLGELGFDAFGIGAIATATLLGSAATTTAIGLIAHRLPRRRLLGGAALLMTATGIGFAVSGQFWPLVAIAFVGTLNPSSGDVSLFLPLEQATLGDSAEPDARTALFARYSLVGALLGAMGALCAGLPEILGRALGVPLLAAMQAVFVLYALLGIAVLVLYRRLPAAIDIGREAAATPLRQSRRLVLSLAALFSLDSFGGGFIVQSLLALWLFDRFELSIATAGTIFFWTGVLSAFSYPLAVRLARRIGLVNTMVFTHLPANIFLVLVPLMPTLGLAVALLLARSALSQMDVPTRTSYVMAVVTPAERAAAASLTAVPRGLASALSPLAAGWLLGISTFGWPLVLGGGLKIAYDLLLLAMFRHVRPPEEMTRAAG